MRYLSSKSNNSMESGPQTWTDRSRRGARREVCLDVVERIVAVSAKRAATAGVIVRTKKKALHQFLWVDTGGFGIEIEDRDRDRHKWEISRC